MKKKKHAGGRPPKYTKTEIMQYKIDKYFESCFTPLRDRNGKFLKNFDREYNENTNKAVYYIRISRCSRYE